jgi:hypothetical protein
MGTCCQADKAKESELDILAKKPQKLESKIVLN